jgi:NADPH:quinone reductase-like Zn-dependent oxidoreductase
MRSLAIANNDLVLRMLPHESVEPFELEGVPLVCALLQTAPPEFAGTAPENRARVLVRKHAFSCNYRDKGIIFASLKGGQGYAKYAYLTIGSEFSGEVVSVGADVTEYCLGDRVMGDNHYIGGYRTSAGVREGVPTNAAASEFEVFHPTKLIRLPPEMSYEAAAAFSLGAQTAYSMARKLELMPGMNILVTAAKSNTALFSISVLRACGANVYATSTSDRFEEQLRGLGVKELFVVDAAQGLTHQDRLCEVAREIGGFDGVIDPFYDLHLGSVMGLLAAGGRYVTCGLAGQYPAPGRQPSREVPDLRQAIGEAVLKNIRIVGNCLGTTADLQHAIAAYRAGDLSVVIDSVYHGQHAREFLQRSFTDRNRFGKVVFSYAPSDR